MHDIIDLTIWSENKENITYYCDNCKTANSQKPCARCGNPDLREATANDVSYFCEMQDNHFATMFIEALKSQNIDVFAVPNGFSMRTRANETVLIYIPVKHLEDAYDTYTSMFG